MAGIGDLLEPDKLKMLREYLMSGQDSVVSRSPSMGISRSMTNSGTALLEALGISEEFRPDTYDITKEDGIYRTVGYYTPTEFESSGSDEDEIERLLRLIARGGKAGDIDRMKMYADSVSMIPDGDRTRTLSATAPGSRYSLTIDPRGILGLGR